MNNYFSFKKLIPFYTGDQGETGATGPSGPSGSSVLYQYLPTPYNNFPNTASTNYNTGTVSINLASDGDSITYKAHVIRSAGAAFCKLKLNIAGVDYTIQATISYLVDESTNTIEVKVVRKSSSVVIVTFDLIQKLASMSITNFDQNITEITGLNLAIANDFKFIYTQGVNFGTTICVSSETVIINEI